MPVPAGMSLPMMTFSFSPIRLSDLPSIAASVRTRVVSWNDAADSHDSVASDAFVIPMRIWRPLAGSPPSLTTRRFSSVKRMRSTSSPGRNVGVARLDDVHAPQHLADDQLDVLVVDRHTLGAVDLLHLADQQALGLAGAEDLEHLVRVDRPVGEQLADA